MPDPIPFTQTKLTRAIAGARKAGMEVNHCEIRPDGTIVLSNQPTPPQAPVDELAAWKAARADKPNRRS